MEKGTLITDKESMSFIVVEDVPFDYRDMSESSLKTSINAFHKVTNVGTQIDMILRKRYIDLRSYTNKVLNKIQNLRIIVENDPSNARAKKEMELLQSLLSKIDEGERPFSYQLVLVIHGKSKEEARSLGEVVMRGLESLGIKSRFADVREIEEIINLSTYSLRREGFPSQIPFITPFSVDKTPKIEMWSKGIYLGKDMTRNTSVFWNVEAMENGHLLVIGPTGSGKTEFLISLGIMMSFNYRIPILFFDSKGDIKSRLKKYGYNFRVLNPFFLSLNLLNSPYVPPSVKPLFLEKVIGVTFRLNREERAILFTSLNRLVSSKEKSRVSWDVLLEDPEISERFSLRRVIEIIKIFENDGPSLIDAVYNGINVVDLTQLKDETLRRFVTYSFISMLYSKYSLSVDQGLRIALVVDEAWSVLRDEEDYGIIGDLIKRGRGHGISLLMATQNIQDLGNNTDVFMENFGVLCFMNNGDKEFWNGIVKRYSNILDADVENRLTFMGRGEMLVRFLGDPRPILVSHKRLAGGSLEN
ncbi:AAA family ATPase [Metallosphaera tengchongensis]|uniref:AAA family ATPase n=1 Tax=Metallosphaera tengchongensis TaxID=1532350 RepID=A0A6N0NVV6_9CREN|nr:AAA family ATPase [Metallosphaera tengchongensis]